MFTPCRQGQRLVERFLDTKTGLWRFSTWGTKNACIAHSRDMPGFHKSGYIFDTRAIIDSKSVIPKYSDCASATVSWFQEAEFSPLISSRHFTTKLYSCTKTSKASCLSTHCVLHISFNLVRFGWSSPLKSFPVLPAVWESFWKI